MEIDLKHSERNIRERGYEWLLRMHGEDKYFCNIYPTGIPINYNNKQYNLKETGEIFELKSFSATESTPELAFAVAYSAFFLGVDMDKPQ